MGGHLSILPAVAMPSVVTPLFGLIVAERAIGNTPIGIPPAVVLLPPISVTYIVRIMHGYSPNLDQRSTPRGGYTTDFMLISRAEGQARA
jgi:hypothetical protein